MSNKTATSSLKNLIFRAKLEALDLEFIALRLMNPEHSLGLTRQEVDLAIANYKQFLYWHYLHPDIAIAPTRAIDTVWHLHLLNTRRYAQDCEWLFGYFLHHVPGNEVEPAILELAFSHTQSLFLQDFGINLKGDEGCTDLSHKYFWQEGACIVLSAPQFSEEPLSSK